MDVMYTDDHVLKVWFTKGGRYFALHWWTYDERGHLVLAPTEAKLREIAARIFNEHLDVELKAYCEIEIVGPTRRFRDLAAKYRMNEDIEQFNREISIRLRDAIKAGYALPSSFALCTEYKFKDEAARNEAEDESADTRELRLDHHYGCTECMMGIRLIGMTPYELHVIYRKRWEARPQQRRLRGRPYKTKGVPVAGASQAPEAADGEPLWFAYSNFGHHSGGLELHQIDYSDLDGGYPPSYIGSHVIFYFRRLRELDLSELTAMRDVSDAGWKLRQEQEEQASAAKREREDREDIESVLEFFKLKQKT